jgi:hypothetical protein
MVTVHPTIAVVAAAVIGLVFVSKPLVIKHLENRAKKLENEDRQALIAGLSKLTANEELLISLLDKAVDKIGISHPQFPQLLPDAASAHWQMAAAASTANRMSFSGLELNKSQLEALGQKRANRRGSDVLMNDVFHVEGVKRFGKKFRIELRSKTTRLVAIFGAPELTEEKIAELTNCMTRSQPINAEVKLRYVEKTKVAGRLMAYSITQAPDKEADEESGDGLDDSN